ncbi:hypothetical protein DIPPA_06669 [Diplonema papillatum]|nr:hypothetical protein DIPPA_06669 [Diplonema papillatum]
MRGGGAGDSENEGLLRKLEKQAAMLSFYETRTKDFVRLLQDNETIIEELKEKQTRLQQDYAALKQRQGSESEGSPLGATANPAAQHGDASLEHLENELKAEKKSRLHTEEQSMSIVADQQAIIARLESKLRTAEETITMLEDRLSQDQALPQRSRRSSIGGNNCSRFQTMVRQQHHQQQQQQQQQAQQQAQAVGPGDHSPSSSQPPTPGHFYSLSHSVPNPQPAETGSVARSNSVPSGRSRSPGAAGKPKGQGPVVENITFNYNSTVPSFYHHGNNANGSGGSNNYNSTVPSFYHHSNTNNNHSSSNINNTATPSAAQTGARRGHVPALQYEQQQQQQQQYPYTTANGVSTPVSTTTPLSMRAPTSVVRGVAGGGYIVEEAACDTDAPYSARTSTSSAVDPHPQQQQQQPGRRSQSPTALRSGTIGMMAKLNFGCSSASASQRPAEPAHPHSAAVETPHSHDRRPSGTPTPVQSCTPRSVLDARTSHLAASLTQTQPSRSALRVAPIDREPSVTAHPSEGSLPEATPLQHKPPPPPPHAFAGPGASVFNNPVEPTPARRPLTSVSVFDDQSTLPRLRLQLQRERELAERDEQEVYRLQHVYLESRSSGRSPSLSSQGPRQSVGRAAATTDAVNDALSVIREIKDCKDQLDMMTEADTRRAAFLRSSSAGKASNSASLAGRSPPSNNPLQASPSGSYGSSFRSVPNLANPPAALSSHGAAADYRRYR